MKTFLIWYFRAIDRYMAFVAGLGQAIEEFLENKVCLCAVIAVLIVSPLLLILILAVSTARIAKTAYRWCQRKEPAK